MARDTAKRTNCSSVKPKRTFRLGSTLSWLAPPVWA